MLNVTYETSGANTYLVYKLEENETLDALGLGMITNNKIQSFIPVLYNQMDNTKLLKYNITSKVPVSQFFSGMVKKKQILGVLSGICNAVLAAEEYMIDENSLILDLDYMYVDVLSCDTQVLCLPLENMEKKDVKLSELIKSIVFSAKFDPTENGDYVVQLFNFLNRTMEFSVTEFAALVARLRNHQAGMQTTSPQMQGGYNQQAYHVQTPPINQTPPQVPPVQPVNQIPPVSSIPPQTPPVNQAPSINNISSQVPPQTPPVNNMQTPPSKMQGMNIPSSNGGGMNIPPTNGNGMNIPPSGKGGMQIPPGSNGAPQNIPPVTPQDGEKKMTMFNLLTHYSKENKELYKAQKAQREQEKQIAVTQTVTVPPVNNGMPGGAGTMPVRPNGPQTPPMNQMPPQTPPMNQVPPQTPPVAPNVPQTPPNINQTQTPPPPTTPSHMTTEYGATTILNASVGETVVLSGQLSGGTPHLVRLKNNEKIMITKPIFKIGKVHGYVDYAVSDNPAVSKSHAQITQENGAYYIQDTNSTNHTYVDGNMVCGVDKAKLEHGTKVRLANEEFEFRTM